MNKPLQYIHIGVGGFGQHWCNAVLPRLKDLGLAVPVAAVDINRETLGKAKTQLGLADDQLFTSAEKAFGEAKADFVTIVVPPAYHEQMVDLAVQHGCHILSEKPIADTMAATCRIYRKVRNAGLMMAVTMSHRFDQDKQTLEAQIKSGRHGRLNYIVGRFTHNCREFASWGKFRHEIADPLLVEGTVHHFDILRALTGSNAKSVYALTWNPPWGHYAGDSTGMVTIEMENGVKCLYEGAKANASTMNGWTNEYFRAECEDGTLELDRRWLRVLRGGAWDKPLSQDLPMLQQPAWMNPWLAELFVNWLNGGDAPPNNLDDNIQCCALLFAAIESAHSGRIIDVQQFLQTNMKAVEQSAGLNDPSAGATGW
ncbi:MAG: Gfo/Idh/MocA family oxidoreductase [Methylacidiphilales bacterium]|nr:Gfo/Idh/MocA family oxidoreductase [Candidatus Methylacidiphilales bacterium]